ncbi:Phenylcoumaran benzylic ether reductase TP7 [Paramyrothecium foliicola]|nr:Phenylcoumaran benzylic ether reductase TP7 [Paramyrothecium foliicola]
MSPPFKNILIIGATGSIGSYVLQALLNEASFTVTALQRASSKNKLSSHVRVISIDDSYPLEDLVSAFKGQDAIVNCMTSLAAGHQLRFIDAAVAANAKRYVASEYGLNNNRPEARELNSVFREKGEIQDYLRLQESNGLEWMSIACGMWLKWSATHNFLGMHLKEKKFVLWDDGEGWFSCTTEENTALGLVHALTKRWEETKNRIVWLSDFAITQNTLLEALERLGGEKLTTETIDSAEFIKQKQAAVEAGDVYATFDLIETGFVTGRYGGHLEEEGEVMNDLLELPKKSLDEVVKAALDAVRSS